MQFYPALLIGLVLSAAPVADWPQYNGANSDRTSRESLDPQALKKPRLEFDWKVPARDGFASFVVEGNRAYTLVLRGSGDTLRETCIALDVEGGQELWATPLGLSKYDGGAERGAEGNDGGDGPRSTPSVVDGKVYVYDAQMILHCLDGASGKSLWRRDVLKNHGGRMIKWQNASSPLVDGGRVFVYGGGAGQSFLAFDANTGELAWARGDERMTHATPIVTDLHGVRQVIFFVQSGLVALGVNSGEELWRAEYPYKVSSAASPVVSGDIVYCSAGYGVGAGAFRIKKGDRGFQAELLWRKRNKLINHWSTPVCHDGYLYGMFSFKKYGEGPLQCVDLATGDVKWSKSGFGPGNAILVGDKVVALADAGEVVVVETDPAEYMELARAQVVRGKCWSSPAIADGRLFIRSTREAACLKVN